MRILTITSIAVAIGLALGGTVALVAFYSETEVTLQVLEEASAARTSADKRAARIEVAESDFNFGIMKQGEIRSHDFVVKNVGDGPLTLRVGPTTCKCTLGVASEAPIQPGESTLVHLEWHSIEGAGAFRQTATLLTNDPQRPQFALVIEGAVSTPEKIEPPEFLFDKISAGQSKSATVYVMSMFEDQIAVSDAELALPEARDFFDIQIDPVERDELPDSEAKAGVRVTLTAKAGLPLGAFNQRLKLRTNLPDAEWLEIPAFGRVISDISIHGNRWDEERGALRMGIVDRSEGKRERLNLVVRGEGAADVQFSIASTDPAELKATLGTPNRLSDTLVHVPLEIEVPAGTHPMARLGTGQSKEGSIILGTTHPIVRELVIGVRFSVER
jgi:hypothetical protein